MDFKEILFAEPELLDIMNDARKFCIVEDSQEKRSQYWYKILKPKMNRMVGWHSEIPELKTPEIYGETYDFFSKLMRI